MRLNAIVPSECFYAGCRIYLEGASEITIKCLQDDWDRMLRDMRKLFLEEYREDERQQCN